MHLRGEAVLTVVCTVAQAAAPVAVGDAPSGVAVGLALVQALQCLRGTL